VSTRDHVSTRNSETFITVMRWKHFSPCLGAALSLFSFAVQFSQQSIILLSNNAVIQIMSTRRYRNRQHNTSVIDPIVQYARMIGKNTAEFTSKDLRKFIRWLHRPEEKERRWKRHVDGATASSLQQPSAEKTYGSS